jgi:hypothetical protein
MFVAGGKRQLKWTRNRTAYHAGIPLSVHPVNLNDEKEHFHQVQRGGWKGQMEQAGAVLKQVSR